MRVLLMLLFTSPVFCADSTDDITFKDQANWPGVCRTGKQQSPIDIVTSEVVVDRLGQMIKGPLIFEGISGVNVTAKNNGFTIMWSLAPASPIPTLSGGPHINNYTFVQFHLHWRSEHAINGFKFPLEIHFLFKRSDLTLEQAMDLPDGLASVAVFCQVVNSKCGQSNQALSQIMPAVPILKQRHGNASVHSVLDLTHLLSQRPQSYFTYRGSMTFPGCREAITWIVMDTPITISDAQLKTILKTDVGSAENFRNLQPRNNRTVWHSNAFFY